MADLLEYSPGAPFPGRLGRTLDQSTPAWPAPLRAKPGAPNVLFVILDDVGYGQLGCYGSPIRTPNLDRLAGHGLCYRNMHTMPMCSPSRACILTGRNAHDSATGTTTDSTAGFPGYNGLVPFENGLLPEMLLPHGYNTYVVGKWHLTAEHLWSAAGPYDRWPLGRGFERFYGFMDWGGSQYYPELVYDNHRVLPPKTPEEGYHLTEDLVDRAIEFVADAKQVDSTKPFFLYFCTGAAHAPQHVPLDWADRYRGAFDDGWEAYRERVFARQLELGIVSPGTVLPPHDPDVPRWETLAAGEQRRCARLMEVYAGFLEHADHHIGRLISFLERIGQLDNTLIMAMSDNGTSPEGGPRGGVNRRVHPGAGSEPVDDETAALDRLGGPDLWNHYPFGWAWAGNTPFRRWKRETYRGGVSVPFIVHWPAGIAARGEIRGQYAHSIDMVPTVLQVLGIEPPPSIRGVPQLPIQGVSFARSFDRRDATSDHHTQYFEHYGHRSIYHRGWRAVCPAPNRPPWPSSGIPNGVRLTSDDLDRIDATGWELYNVDEDPAEARNLAGQEPERLRELIALWYAEAEQHHVLPIDGFEDARLYHARPRTAGHQSPYVYFSGTQLVPEKAAAEVLNRPHSITAEVDIPPAGAEGVLISHGGKGSFGGYTFFIAARLLHYVHSYMGREFQVTSTAEVPTGRVSLRFEFEPTGEPDIPAGRGCPGRASLFIDGRPVGSAEIPVTMAFLWGGGIETGRDGASRPAVSSLYRPPFPFTGHMYSVTVVVDDDARRDPAAEMRAKLGME